MPHRQHYPQRGYSHHQAQKETVVLHGGVGLVVADPQVAHISGVPAGCPLLMLAHEWQVVCE